MKKTIPMLLMVAVLLQCSDDDNDTPNDKEGCTFSLSENYDPKAVIDDGSCRPVSCQKCTYTVPADITRIDGTALDLKPGDFICLDAALKYKNLLFENLIGTTDNPITIINCGGPVQLDATGKNYGLAILQSKYFKVKGIGEGYSIRVSGGTTGVALTNLSTNFELSGLEVFNSVNSGIVARTAPDCDDATIRENFTMNDVSIHHNAVHDTGTEGLYIGSAFYYTGETTPCGTRLAHEIHGLTIFNNTIKNTGWDGIQVGSATENVAIYNNTIDHAGVAEETYQQSGLYLAEGTTGTCYGNIVTSPLGNGLQVYGIGDNLVYNNVIANAGGIGLLCYEATEAARKTGYRIINNTIIDPTEDGIFFRLKTVSGSYVVNNIVTGPGTLGNYGDDTDKAYLYIYGDIAVETDNNYFAATRATLKFKNDTQGDYQLTAQSPAKDAGRDVSALTVKTDLLGKPRPSGKAFDIGAYEIQE